MTAIAAAEVDMSQYIHRQALGRLSAGASWEDGGGGFRGYGQEGQGTEGLVEQVTEVYDAAGNLVSEVKDVFVEEDPELAPVEESSEVGPTTTVARPPSFFRKAQWFLMDADGDHTVTKGEMKVFGLGLLSGFLIKSIWR